MKGISKKYYYVGGFFVLMFAAVLFLPASSAEKHPEPVNENRDLVVQLCDGQTQLVVEGVREGETLSPEKARELTGKLMALYAEKQEIQSTKWTDRDRLVWETEQKRLTEMGDKLFHSSKPPISTIGVSCDMCHPNASNTHPETYPKFQPQLKKVAALRDMINWCIENPSKGQPLELDDERMHSWG